MKLLRYNSLELSKQISQIEKKSIALQHDLEIIQNVYASNIFKIFSKLIRKPASYRDFIKQSSIETTNFKEIKTKLLLTKSLKGPIIYPPTIEWNIPLTQRPQHMAKAFADKGYLFFYCTNNIYDDVVGYQKIQKSLYVTNQFPALIDSTCRGWILFNAAHPGYSLDDLIAWKNQGYRIIYQYIDELDPQIVQSTSFDNISKRHQSVTTSHIDIVIVSAKRLMSEMLRKFPRSRVVYVPNGVDYGHFRAKKRTCPKDIAPIKKKKRPVIGYHGAIASWIDVDLLLYLADHRPEYEIVMIGWDFDGTVKSLQNKQNIHLLGIKSYEIIPNYIAQFDVAIIPFKKGNIAKSTSPLKLFEFMSAQKQVVVTGDMDECRDYEGVTVAPDHKAFVQAIDDAILSKKNIKLLESLANQGKENSWSSRIITVEKMLRKFDKPPTSLQQFKIRIQSLELISNRQAMIYHIIHGTKIFRAIDKVRMIASLFGNTLSITILVFIEFVNPYWFENLL